MSDQSNTENSEEIPDDEGSELIPQPEVETDAEPVIETHPAGPDDPREQHVVDPQVVQPTVDGDLAEQDENSPGE